LDTFQPDTLYFRQYLYSRKFSGNQPSSSWIFSVEGTCSRLLRWRLKLKEYNHKVIYKKGSKNTKTNTPHRIHIIKTCPENKNQKVQITPDEKLKIFQEIQEKPTGGHL
jgi:hypothetical protein